MDPNFKEWRYLVGLGFTHASAQNVRKEFVAKRISNTDFKDEGAFQSLVNRILRNHVVLGPLLQGDLVEDATLEYLRNSAPATITTLLYDLISYWKFLHGTPPNPSTVAVIKKAQSLARGVQQSLILVRLFNTPHWLMKYRQLIAALQRQIPVIEAGYQLLQTNDTHRSRFTKQVLTPFVQTCLQFIDQPLTAKELKALTFTRSHNRGSLNTDPLLRLLPSGKFTISQRVYSRHGDFRIVTRPVAPSITPCIKLLIAMNETRGTRRPNLFQDGQKATPRGLPYLNKVLKVQFDPNPYNFIYNTNVFWLASRSIKHGLSAAGLKRIVRDSDRVGLGFSTSQDAKFYVHAKQTEGLIMSLDRLGLPLHTPTPLPELIFPESLCVDINMFKTKLKKGLAARALSTRDPAPNTRFLNGLPDGMEVEDGSDGEGPIKLATLVFDTKSKFEIKSDIIHSKYGQGKKVIGKFIKESKFTGTVILVKRDLKTKKNVGILGDVVVTCDAIRSQYVLTHNGTSEFFGWDRLLRRYFMFDMNYRDGSDGSQAPDGFAPLVFNTKSKYTISGTVITSDYGTGKKVTVKQITNDKFTGTVILVKRDLNTKTNVGILGDVVVTYDDTRSQYVLTHNGTSELVRKTPLSKQYSLFKTSEL